MLEQLADHDDELLEQLLMDETPAPEKIFQDLARETGENLGVSVLFGSANSSWGVRRLLKALRHEAPGAAAAAKRLSVSAPSLYVFKVYTADRPPCTVTSTRRSGRRRIGRQDGRWRTCARRLDVQSSGREDAEDRRGTRRRHRCCCQAGHGQGGAMAGLRDGAAGPSKSTIPRATARSPSSRPIARMT